MAPYKGKKKVPAIYTEQEIIDAIRSCGGYLTHVAAALKCPVESLKKEIDRNKKLKLALMESKESCIDLAQSKLMERVKNGDLLAIMFYLKCQAGWDDRPGKKAGSSEDKPLFIKITGISGNKEEKRGPGRPKMQEVHAKVPAIAATVAEEILEGEILN